MAITEKMVGDVRILIYKGKMMDGSETNELHKKLQSLIEEGVKKVVLDLGKVKWMNSAGVGVLCACQTTFASRDGHLKLARVTKKIKSLLIITKLINVFQNYDTVEDAVDSFG